MVQTASQAQQPPQQDEDQIYDVILIVENTANLVPYLDELKTSYLLPTLEHFNGGPPSPIDTGHDYNCTLYCLVTYSAGDAHPERISDCTYPTTSTHELIQSFDNLEFAGGAGQSCSLTAEGLGTALECLDEIKQLRFSGKPSQRHCILICNSPPYQILAEESQDYRGYSCEQLAVLMGQKGVHLSIISPRKIPALQKLYNEASAADTFHTHQQGYYAVDPRHLVLLKGYQLQERSMSPPKVEEEKKPGPKAPSPAQTIQNAVDAFKKPLTTQSGMLPPQGTQTMMQHPGLSQGGQSTSMNSQQSSTPQVVMSGTATMPNNIDLQSQASGKHGLMMPIGAQGEQAKVQGQAGLVGTSKTLQIRMRQQNQAPQDNSILMRQQSMGNNQGMMNMQQPQGGNMITSQQVPQQTVPNSQANMMSTQAMGSMPPGATQNSGMLPQMGGPQAAGLMQGAQQNPGMISSSSSQNTSGMLQHTVSPQNPNVMQSGGPQNPNMLQATAGVMGMPQQQGQQPQGQQQPTQPSTQQQQQFPQQSSYMPDSQGMPQHSQLPLVPGAREKRIIWTGTLEYPDRNMQAQNQQNVNLVLNCNVYIEMQDAEINTSDWPPKLTIQLLPQRMLTSLQQLCKNNRQVFFHFPNSSASPNNEALANNLYMLMMSNGFAGCVKLPPQSETKIILVIYSGKKRSLLGIIPTNQTGIMQGIKKVVTVLKQRQQHQQQNIAAASAVPTSLGHAGAPGMPGNVASSQAAAVSSGGMMQPQMPMQVNAGQQQPQATQQQQSNPQQQQQQQQVPGQQQDQRRANLMQIQTLHNDLQAAKQRELQFQQQQQQQQPQGVDQKKVIMVQQQQQSQQQVQQQQFLAHRAKLQQQQQLQRLQMQQQQQQQQQQVANPQLRHMLMNQQQIRQQLLMQQHQHMRGGAPQSQPGGVMGPGGQQTMQGGAMGQIGQPAPQNFMEEFNLPEIL